MARCVKIIENQQSRRIGERCTRSAVAGSRFCQSHGGVEDSTTPQEIRFRNDQTRQHCRATTRAGNPCRQWAIHGGTVCKTHGGNLPQIKKAARERFMDLIDPMINITERMAKDAQEGRMTHRDQLKLVAFIADRTGYGSKSEVDVSVRPFEQIVSKVFKTFPVEEPPPPPAPLAIEAGKWTYDDAEDESEEPPMVRPDRESQWPN